MQKSPWDNYCWSCHQFAVRQHNETSNCGECARVFHTKCIDKNSICHDCNAPRIRPKDITSEDYTMLKLLADKWISDENFDVIDKKICTKPLSIIRSKIIAAEYKNFAQLTQDIKLSVHKVIASFSREHKTVESAKRFQNDCIDQMEMIQACLSCYENASKHPNKYGSIACKELHSVIWTRYKESVFWPSKLMSADGSKGKVWLFGHHMFAEVSSTDCLLYSHERPDEDKDACVTDAFDDALMEANEYIENLKKLTEFNYAEANEPFIPDADENHSVALDANETQNNESLNVVLTEPGLSSTPVANGNTKSMTRQLNFSETIPTIHKPNGEDDEINPDDDEPVCIDSNSNGSKSDGSNCDGSKLDGSNRDGSKPDGSNRDGSKPDGSNRDGSKSDGSNCEGSKQDGSNSDRSHSEYSISDDSNETPSGQGGSDNDADILNSNEPESQQVIPDLEQTHRKRKASDEDSQPPRKVAIVQDLVINPKSVLYQSFHQIIAKTEQLEMGMERYKNRIDELEAENQRLTNDIAKQKTEFEAQLKQSVKDIKGEQWCPSCDKALPMKYHCGDSCQQLYWKRKEGNQDTN